MRVAVDTDEAVAMQASAAEAARVSAAAAVRGELVVATAEPGLAAALAAMGRGIIHRAYRPDATVATRRGNTHPESQRDAMEGTGKGTTRREHRVEGRFMVQLRGRKVGPLPNSLLVRRSTLVATTHREIDPELALPGNPTCNPVIIRE